MSIPGGRAQPEDREIVASVLRGDTADFRYLVTRYEKRVIGLCARMLASREDAMDSAQDAFIRAYSSLASYDVEMPLWPWLRRIAVNCCLKLARMKSNRAESEMDEDYASEDRIVDDLLCKEESERLLREVSRLPQTYRTVVVLRYQEDLSAPEIAEMLGDPPGTIRVRLHRGLKMLAERLAVTANDL